MRAPRSRQRQLLAAASYGLAGIALGWFATRYADTGTQLLAVLAALSPFALGPAVLGLAAAVAARSRIAAATSACMCMFVIAAQVPTLVPATSPPLHGASLTVLTLNMKFGEADAAAVVALAASSNTDIVALEELTPAALPRLAQAGLDRDFPYSVVAPSTAANGVGLFSRRPLSRMTLSNVWPSGAVAAHVELGNGLGPITVYVVHVPAPWPQRDGLWLQQLRTIPQTIADIAGPLVMAGDFNSTMEHAPFRTMLSASAMADAADVAGAGWLPTYPSDSAVPPVIAIDHVLTRGASATAVHTVTVRGSDHRAVVATLTVG